VGALLGQVIGIWPEVSYLADFADIIDLKEAKTWLSRPVYIGELDPTCGVLTRANNPDDVQRPTSGKPFNIEPDVVVPTPHPFSGLRTLVQHVLRQERCEIGPSPFVRCCPIGLHDLG
jgi:hypothetical protein